MLLWIGLRGLLGKCAGVSTVRAAPEGITNLICSKLMYNHCMSGPHTVARWCARFHISALKCDGESVQSVPTFMPDYESVKLLER